MSIHFSQSNGLWRSDWFYTELNIPKPVQLKSWSSAVPMLTPLNHLKCLHDSIFFHSGRQLNWISPKWLSISCLRVTSGYGCWGIQTHSPIHLTPISHLAQSEWMPVLQKCKKKINRNAISKNVTWELNKNKLFSLLIMNFSSLVILSVWKHVCIFNSLQNVLDRHGYSVFFFSARISFLCLNRRPYSAPAFWRCSQMRPWPWTSLSVALYSTAALSGRDSMTCFPAWLWIAAGTSLQPVY